MTDSPSIKVLVACHKPIACPASNIYMPVQLGASTATHIIEGMQRDDEGDNISERNFTFCELSAQYWGWKNLDADYIGLCHYRRYFCFDGIDHPANDHAQIEIPCLSPASAAHYRLDDDALASEAIVQHDMIVPQRWDVRMTPTPLGPQPTIRRHMVAYGLMTNDTLNKLVELCAERQPDYAPFVEKYLEDYMYQGYNCFIMKRSLFDRFCAFEFDVLKAFDDWFDYTDITTTKKRIAGYLGEILISAFTLKLESEDGHDIANYPLTFFEDTPPLASLDTQATIGQKAKLIWNFPYDSPALLAVCLKSLGQSPFGRQLDATLIVPSGFDTVHALKLAGSLPDDLAITWAAWPAIDGYPLLGATLDEAQAACILPFALPWLATGSDRLWWVDGIVLFGNGQLPLAGHGLQAAKDIHLQRELNKPPFVKADLLCDERRRHVQVLGAHFLTMNCATLREHLSLDVMIALFGQMEHKVTNALPGADTDLRQAAIRATMLDELGATALPYEDATLGLNVADTKTWGNEDEACAWLAAQDPAIAVFGPDGPPDPQRRMPHSGRFWETARESAAYEALLFECQQPHQGGGLRDKLLPAGSRRREIARSVALAIKSRKAADPL